MQTSLSTTLSASRHGPEIAGCPAGGRSYLRHMSLEHTKASAQQRSTPSGRRRNPSPSLSAERLGRWLAQPALHCDDGQILSWLNPAHPGYPYPEASALWLSWAAWRHEQRLPAPPRQAARRAAAWLHAQLSGPGAIGRQGRSYAFDTGLAVHALVRAARTPGLIGLDRSDLPSLSAGLDAFLDADQPALPGARGAARWSERWGGHMVRAAALVLQAGLWLDHPPTQQRARRMLARAVRIQPDQPCYLHALAYQAEGDLLLTSLGVAGLHQHVPHAAQRLAQLQRPDGLLPGWSDRPDSARCDTTAQAVRLWAATDPERFADAIAAALAALARCQQPEGGLPYEPGGLDMNTWAGLFADQAARWATHGADPASLL